MSNRGNVFNMNTIIIQHYFKPEFHNLGTSLPLRGVYTILGRRKQS